MQDINKHLRQGIERNSCVCKDGGVSVPKEEVKTWLCCTKGEAKLVIPELTDSELEDMNLGFKYFDEQYDTSSELSVMKMRYFVRMAYFHGYIYGKNI
jgi:hypothetical protein